jgi:signal transduction histidine kinase
VVGVQHSADGLTTLLNNLLDLARVEAGRLELDMNDADLEALINEVLQMVGPLAQRKHVPLIAAIDPDLDPWMRVDSSRFRQILLNLVSNAVKFTEDGAVTVVARPIQVDREKWVDVAVTDTGPGMTPAELETIFEAFVQASSGVHKKHGGSGFGLATRAAADLGDGRRAHREQRTRRRHCVPRQAAGGVPGRGPHEHPDRFPRPCRGRGSSGGGGGRVPCHAALRSHRG